MIQGFRQEWPILTVMTANLEYIFIFFANNPPCGAVWGGLDSPWISPPLAEIL